MLGGANSKQRTTSAAQSDKFVGLDKKRDGEIGEKKYMKPYIAVFARKDRDSDGRKGQNKREPGVMSLLRDFVIDRYHCPRSSVRGVRMPSFRD